PDDELVLARQGIVDLLELPPGWDDVDVGGQLYVAVIIADDDVLGQLVAHQNLKRTQEGIARNPEVPCRAVVHGEIPNQAAPSDLPESGRNMHGVGGLPYPAFLVADRDHARGSIALFCQNCPPWRYRDNAM